MKSFKKIMLQFVFTSAVFLALPSFAFAAHPSFALEHDGEMRIFGVEVTSVSDNVVNGIIRFKNNLSSNVVINTSASTTLHAEGNAKATSTRSFSVGDLLDVRGMLSSLSGGIVISANKIKEVTTPLRQREVVGTVISVNTSNNSFVLKTNSDKNITVNTNSETKYFVGNNATSSFVTLVTINSSLRVHGNISNDENTLVASKILTKKVNEKNPKKEENKHSNHEMEKMKDNEHKNWGAKIKENLWFKWNS